MIINRVDSITIEKPIDVCMEQVAEIVDYTDNKGNLTRRERKVKYLIIKGKLDDGKSFEYRIDSPYIAQIKVNGKLYSEYEVGKTPEIEFERTDL